MERSGARAAPLIAILALLAGCAPTPSSAQPPHPGIETTEIRVGNSELTVWVADSGDERGQGLRGVESLPEGVQGMLFAWESPTTPTFGMRDTLIPLDLWWFSPDGSLIGKTEMSTCPDGDCDSYGSPGPVRWALETPAGLFAFPGGEPLTASAIP